MVSTTDRRYVYAVLHSGASLPPRLEGIEGAPLAIVRSRDLAAVTSRLERGAVVYPTRENVLRHEAVVEAMRLSNPALPVRFGTLLADPAAVVAALTIRHAELKSDLARLGDKVEMGITALWRELPSDGDLHQERSTLGDREAGGRSRGPGWSYMQERFRLHARESSLRRRASEAWSDLDDLLGPGSIDSWRVILPSPGLAYRATFLLGPNSTSTFEAAFEEARRARADLSLLMTGPWPPYSFVTANGASRQLGTDLLGAIGRPALGANLDRRG